VVYDGLSIDDEFQGNWRFSNSDKNRGCGSSQFIMRKQGCSQEKVIRGGVYLW
jgi:hypothetical protein